MVVGNPVSSRTVTQLLLMMPEPVDLHHDRKKQWQQCTSQQSGFSPRGQGSASI